MIVLPVGSWGEHRWLASVGQGDKRVDFCDDEARFRKAVKSLSELIEGRVKTIGADSREKLRDAIRSESFAKSFQNDLKAASLSI